MAGENGGLISGGYNPLEAPDAPTSVSGSAGDASIDVSFTAPSDVGGAAIQTYIAVATASGETTAAEGSSSPVTISGLTNGTAYSISAYAKNTYGYSPAGLGTGTVSPVAPRALFFGGQGPSSDTDLNRIDYVVISTTGNATDFGDISEVAGFTSAAGNASRSLVAGWRSSGTAKNVIEYVTPSSAGNTQDFGDLTVTRFWAAGTSNSTRAVIGGGDEGNVIDYVTIATTGNATNFGDLTVSRSELGAAASPTRAVFAGGGGPQNVIDYITIASTGNATDFGDLPEEFSALAGCSSSTRALFANVRGVARVHYVTIASTGNSVEFGELSYSGIATDIMAASSNTRGLFAGGISGGTYYNNIDYVTIASTGNGADFGDLTISRERGAGTSMAHGGLQ